MKSRICISQNMKMIGCVSLKPIPILLTVLVITVVGLSLISVPVAADDSAIASGVGTWKSTTSYPTGIGGQSCVVSGGYIYCVGGDTGVSPYETSAVYFAKLSSSGVGVWTETTSYPIALGYGSCVVSGGYIYCVGGYSEVSPYYYSAVYFAKLSKKGVGTWKSTTSYPTIIYVQSCDVSGGYVYCVGGESGSGPTSAVYFASLSSSGIGTWKVTTSYPISISYESCVVSGGYVYCVGGYSPYTSAVYYAKLSSGGVGTWKVTTSYPTTINDQSCVVSGGYVYCVGGDNGPTTFSAVYFAKLSSKEVGVWTETTSYPTTINYESCVANGGYIYCIGGFGPGSAVYYAKL